MDPGQSQEAMKTMSDCLTAERCPLCKGPNGCRLATTATYKGPCWCEQTEVPEAMLSRLPKESVGRICVCASCVTEHHQTHGNRPVSEARDYYTDELGRVVFTEAYHLRRGYCCDQGCRHCPFDSTRKSPEAVICG